MNDEDKQIEIIMNTIVNYISSEFDAKIDQKKIDFKKKMELKKLVKDNLIETLKSMNKKELLPSRNITTKEEFSQHILKLMNIVRPLLIIKIKAESKI